MVIAVRSSVLAVSLLAFAGVVCADILFTAQFVTIHGVLAEANPLVRYLIEKGGVGLMAVVKLLLLGMALWVFSIYHNTKPKVALSIIWALTVLHLPIIYMGWALTKIAPNPAIMTV